MKKSQLRANLLDETAPFVNPQQRLSNKPSKQMHQQFPPQHYQNMQYVNHPLQQYPSSQQNQYNGSSQYYPPQHQQRPPQNYQSYSAPNQNYNSGYYNHNGPPPPPQQQQNQQMREVSRSHASYPNNQTYQYDQGNPQQQQYMDRQRGSYNGPYQSAHSQAYEERYSQQNQTQNILQPSQPQQQRSQSHSYLQHQQPSDTIPIQQGKQRATSYSYTQTLSNTSKNSERLQPLNPNQQIFSIDDSDDDETTTKPKTTDLLDQDKIQQLEEKIQRLERVLALQDLENKITNKDESDIFAQPSSLSVGAEKTQQKQDSLNSVNSSITELGAPPLPPPPPPEKKSLLNSPKANLFVSEMESENIKKLKDSDLRLSTSSLIPTDKSLSDQSLDDAEDLDHHFNDNDNDEPPPSYEELEKSGTLTYSQSIYRTGFEKAGYQLDHVATPLSTPKDVKTTLKQLAELELNDAGSKDSNIRILNKKKSNILMSKRKIPSQITDDMFDNSSFKNALNSIPTHQSIDKPIKTHPQHPIDHQYIPIPVPEPAVPSSQPQKQNYNYKAPSQTLATKSTDTLNKASTLDSSYTNKKSNDVMNVIKYSTDSSFEILANGVIQPILPSKCKESPEETIAKFRKTREKALADYKQFTPKIQFYWAILLLETLSKSEVISKMTIDGKIRKSELSFKKLKKQRSMFLITAVKVLEKLIQIAPNETRARLYLGDIYSGGIHPGLIERDETLGYQLFYDSATKQNDPVACYRIACCLESGVGVKQDIPKSIIFFEKGASLGDPSSMCQLGMMHFAGVNGCVQDILLSISYHKQAYETLRSKTVMSYDPLISSRSFQDARGALYTLAKLHQTDSQILCLTDLNDLKTSKTIDDLKFSNVWCNKSKALKYYLEASKLGHNESQACLGYYYSQGFFPTHLFKSDKDSNNGIADPVDPRKSIYWFSKAAADGHTYASLGLARWYGSGAVDNDGKVILKRDEQQAFLWGRKAADAGELVEAEFMIGVCFEQGFGVEKNLIMAANYFERSARKGYKKSIVKLKAMRKQ